MRIKLFILFLLIFSLYACERQTTWEIRSEQINTVVVDAIITDEFKGYNIITNKTDYIHLRIDHSKAYTNGSIHTNNVESFWAILKRGIYGIYHHVSVEWLQNYVNEFCFRFNHRKNSGVMFDLVLTQAVL